MTSRTKMFPDLTIGLRSCARSVIAGTFVALALYAVGCSGDVQDKRPTSSSNSASSSGAGGEGGSVGTGMGGNGGNAGFGGTGGGSSFDGGSGGVEYAAFNLFTHVPRFVVFKVDHARNLCFRIWVEGLGGPGALGINVTSPWGVERAEVTNDVNDCVVSGGFPVPPMTYADATAGMGSMVLQGQFPCALDLHATISFSPIGPWVPASEPFDVDALPVDGGCN